MSFYGPTFPNETHYERLFSGRQRFGNRSANMFFVRPARHIACPRRLKYIHDIKTGIIPYVEDSPYESRPSARFGYQRFNDEERNKSDGLGLYNSTDAWRQELMELAQQVTTTLAPSDDQDIRGHQCRSPRLHMNHYRRSNSSALSNCSDDNNDNNHQSKRLLSRRFNSQFARCQSTKPKSPTEKTEQEQAPNDENQDSGIWLIPLLCYVLQMDNILEAQEWLMNANPTEKRLAMELISRTMQDMQNFENEMTSDVSITDTSTTAQSFNNVYWPYKIWQKQEKQRHQLQDHFKQLKPRCHSTLPSASGDNNDTCERATSPMRMVTPAKRSSNGFYNVTPVDTMTLERSMVRATSTSTPRQHTNLSSVTVTDQGTSPRKHRSSTMNTSARTECRSRRGYRVSTSLNHSVNQSTTCTSPVPRGKTPLI